MWLFLSLHYDQRAKCLIGQTRPPLVEGWKHCRIASSISPDDQSFWLSFYVFCRSRMKQSFSRRSSPEWNYEKRELGELRKRETYPKVTRSKGCRPCVQCGGRHIMMISFCFAASMTWTVKWHWWPSSTSRIGRASDCVSMRKISVNHDANRLSLIHPFEEHLKEARSGPPWVHSLLTFFAA